ncbi:hypothetical protein [Thermobrachium celere]|uniref:hypothetical protein n=1 Tax=Thermobrachium celere TaxID=53422 RepID=UPI001943C5D7|nr:hypothetical protein [Thermobrachium celere]GFR36489.1 hypothetical protein TCEA9_23010 [Thermobrachium celere]
MEEANLITILNFIDEIRYKSNISPDIDLIQTIIEKTIEDFYKKLRNRINYVINSNNYIFTDKIKQWDGKEGDFISKYSVTINFKSLSEKESFIKNYIEKK